MVVAFGFYAVAPAMVPAPSRVTHAALMRDSAVTLPISSISVVNPTPVRLVIPSIGVDASIEARGLDGNRNLDTPADYRDVAWYRLGPRPGEPGNAVINGHVSWWIGDAVFMHLSRLRVGDEVHIARVDGRVVTFKVTGKSVVDANARMASLFAPSSKSTLTLITCSGAWNPLTQSDTQRLIVSAAIA